ncbi:MerR family transcriptional regulator [Clostridium estertheticum]|uniref:MerR family transcriptional regulator n=1 Tax=Clostridium estertheticum TaxID=238834 RepID=UPI0013EE56DC|nr:MerR family transcriptional regulator [Clostridium estertheticum]MBZ9607267.1 MerR family transcriptional regulator [Clostridium estertheticum]
MNDNKYFSTGEFAKLANISKQTLIFYDKKGIFSPEYKNNNNFRYYSLKQFDTLDLLITLRDIGLSLEDIKKYLDTRTPQNAINILEKENNSLKKQIEHLKNIEKKIENKIDITKKAIESEYISEPYIKECDEEFIIKSEQVESNDFKIITMEMIKFMNFCKKISFLIMKTPLAQLLRKKI